MGGEVKQLGEGRVAPIGPFSSVSSKGIYDDPGPPESTHSYLKLKFSLDSFSQRGCRNEKWRVGI